MAIVHLSAGSLPKRVEPSRHERVDRYWLYLEQALQQLVRADVLTGVRGPRGGYNLARERRRISVGDIVRVVRDLETGTDLDNGNPGSELTTKVITPMWRDLQVTLMGKLDSISIDDLCTQANGAGVESEGRQNLDFSI